ncbi:ABC transporter permease subunit [Lignipirellula cremea]|uniref:ABC-2 family transporter protein n=1 Tax=Lignipirellula cremea TaxID=2528010 RepID=A0A518DR72_9BACT|nr:ABC transporter permease subunit [Lignipirellula cremea]QDU94322.1 ABC-2 family transporter protein [Lignipirellula cremea]
MSTNTLLFAAVAPQWVIDWLTPVWILGLGCIFGLLLVGLLWGIVWLLGLVWPRARQFGDEMPRLVTEGAMGPMLAVIAGLALFGVSAFPLAPAPEVMVKSIFRPQKGGTQTVTVEVAPAPADQEPEPIAVEVSFDGDELQRIDFDSNEDVLLLVNQDGDKSSDRFTIEAGRPQVFAQNVLLANPFSGQYWDKLYAVNNGTAPATLTMKIQTGSPYPQMQTVWIAGLCIGAVFLFYLLLWAFTPRMSAVAFVTTKSEIAQPAFLLLTGGGAALIFAFIWIPYFTFGEDIKVLKDSGLTTIMICGIGLAVWAATKSVSEEIEGRTALTVLSKPIQRRSFLIGKFVGIMWAVLLLFVLLGVVFMVCVAYKPIFDGREGATDATWESCFEQMISVVPGLVLAYLETFVLAAISVAISTRLPMLANFSLTFTIYLLGNLSPQIVQSSEGRFAPVKFVAGLIATVFPVLDHFNIQAAIAGGQEVPNMYLVGALFYSLIYGGIALLVALVFFEDRDLA